MSNFSPLFILICTIQKYYIVNLLDSLLNPNFPCFSLSIPSNQILYHINSRALIHTQSMNYLIHSYWNLKRQCSIHYFIFSDLFSFYYKVCVCVYIRMCVCLYVYVCVSMEEKRGSRVSYSLNQQAPWVVWNWVLWKSSMYLAAISFLWPLKFFK